MRFPWIINCVGMELSTDGWNTGLLTVGVVTPAPAALACRSFRYASNGFRSR